MSKTPFMFPMKMMTSQSKNPQKNAKKRKKCVKNSKFVKNSNLAEF